MKNSRNQLRTRASTLPRQNEVEELIE